MADLTPLDWLRAARAASCWFLAKQFLRWTYPTGMVTLSTLAEDGYMLPVQDYDWRRDKTWMK
jgi:hypothetical protein